MLPERLALADVADMYFHYRHLAVLYCIAQRYARMRVPACVQYYSVAIKVLNRIDQVAFVVRLEAVCLNSALLCAVFDEFQ